MLQDNFVSMKKIGFLLVLVIDLFVGYAQDIYFDHLDLKDGLSQISVTAIEQDHLGTMWIGTRDGLNRYNGYEIDVFRHDRLNPNSLLGNNIRDLQADDSTRVWILTWEGLSSYNIETEELINYPYNEINCFYIGKSNIWVGTKNGLLSLDVENKKYVSVNDIVPSSTNITEVIEVGENELFMGTATRGLLNYNKETKKLETILKDDVSCIYHDKKETLWVGTKTNGIFEIHDKEIPVHYNKNIGLAHDVVRDICEDKDGNI